MEKWQKLHTNAAGRVIIAERVDEFGKWTLERPTETGGMRIIDRATVSAFGYKTAAEMVQAEHFELLAGA